MTKNKQSQAQSISSVSKSNFSPKKISDCFIMDSSELNPEPNGFFKKIFAVFISSRYSMPTLMRLTQYYNSKHEKARNFLSRRIYWRISSFFLRCNQILNNFEHGVAPKIAHGIVFHHTGVCITADTEIETNVHIYRNVTFGTKMGKAPIIRRGAKIASHSMVIGGVVVGENAIVAPEQLY